MVEEEEEQEQGGAGGRNARDGGRRRRRSRKRRRREAGSIFRRGANDGDVVVVVKTWLPLARLCVCVCVIWEMREGKEEEAHGCAGCRRVGDDATWECPRLHHTQPSQTWQHYRRSTKTIVVSFLLLWSCLYVAHQVITLRSHRSPSPSIPILSPPPHTQAPLECPTQQQEEEQQQQ